MRAASYLASGHGVLVTISREEPASGPIIAEGKRGERDVASNRSI